MAETDKTPLGDRMKEYEAPSTGRKAFKGQPLIARLDGKSFHTYTKGLRRPYDERLSWCMQETMKALVDRFQCRVGYTQSDEITLAWYYSPTDTGEYPYDGRFQKLESLLAAFCTLKFNHFASLRLGGHGGEPIFDCRAFVVPNLQEAYHAFLWRQQDATKNAISMAAHAHFSHKSLQGMHGAEMQERLFAEKGINFNDYPAFFKRGTFAKRVKVERMLTEDEMRHIPEAHRPTGPVLRTELQTLDLWLSKEADPVKVLFG